MNSVLQLELGGFENTYVAIFFWSFMAIGLYFILKEQYYTPGSAHKNTKSGGQLLPESLYLIESSGPHLRHTFPNGDYEEINWDDLQSVEIQITDQGPMLPDVFWVIADSQSKCVIAQGAQGESEMLSCLQQLPGFDNEQLINAMGSVTNQRFLCWQPPMTADS